MLPSTAHRDLTVKSIYLSALPIISVLTALRRLTFLILPFRRLAFVRQCQRRWQRIAKSVVQAEGIGHQVWLRNSRFILSAGVRSD